MTEENKCARYPLRNLVGIFIVKLEILSHWPMIFFIKYITKESNGSVSTPDRRIYDMSIKLFFQQKESVESSDEF